MQPPPLAYKKWALQDQDDAMDQISCGQLNLFSLCTYDNNIAPNHIHVYINTSSMNCLQSNFKKIENIIANNKSL